MSSAGAGVLPELATVPWRRPATVSSLRRSERLWTLATVAHASPFVVAAAVLAALQPLTIPLGLILLAHAWAIPELYAARGARVVRPPRRAAPPAEQVAVGLLGDLVDHAPRALHGRTGLVLERGRFGVWLLGEQGALLIRPGGRHVHCYCVHVPEPGLPPSDQIAHLLLALREDETGFATVANLAFAGARWRVRRRLAPRARPALEEALAHARGRQP